MARVRKVSKKSDQTGMNYLLYKPTVCANEPIAPVTAMPIEPPSTTRVVAFTTLVPAVFALMTPAMVKPTIVTRVILIGLLSIRGKKNPMNGIKPPKVKLKAEAIAA